MLKHKLVEMANLVQQVVSSTIRALATSDIDLAHQTIEDDELVDKLEVEIDELVLKLLALQQPMAIDLRFLITALKINNDLERMGDQATNIAQNVLLLHEMRAQGALPDLVDFTAMEQTVLEMVGDTISAFTSGNVELAHGVITRDDEVDEMNRNIIGKLARHLRTHAQDADMCVALLLITRNLERIGDLSTNIAEDVVYYIEGKIIKHAH
jgi:phosphate transport system protein